MENIAKNFFIITVKTRTDSYCIFFCKVKRQVMFMPLGLQKDLPSRVLEESCWKYQKKEQDDINGDTICTD